MSLIHAIAEGIQGSVLCSLLLDELCIESEYIYSEVWIRLFSVVVLLLLSVKVFRYWIELSHQDQNCC